MPTETIFLLVSPDTFARSGMNTRSMTMPNILEMMRITALVKPINTHSQRIYFQCKISERAPIQ